MKTERILSEVAGVESFLQKLNGVIGLACLLLPVKRHLIKNEMRNAGITEYNHLEDVQGILFKKYFQKIANSSLLGE